MKVNVYPIKSTLHNKKALKRLTDEFLNSIKQDDIEINLVDNVENLYQCDLPLILIQSGGSENEFLKLQNAFQGPYYLLTYGSNNSLAASLEILTYLKNNNLEGEVLHGNSSYIISRIKSLSKTYKQEHENFIKNRTKQVKLGVIGKPSNWLISSNVDYNNCFDKFNIELVDISVKEVEDLYNDSNIKIDSKEVDDYLRITTPELEKAYRFYYVLKIIIDKYQLSGFTIRCFDLLTSLKTTACLALAIFNNEMNFVATCEGDVPSMIGMYIAKTYLQSPSFQCNPSKIEVEENKIILAHCTIPLCMCTSFNHNTHFESNSGIGIKGELLKGDITIFRLNSKLNKAFISQGEILENLSRDDLCRTQIYCHIENAEKLLKNPLGNHLLVVYGHQKEKLIEYFKKHKIEII